MKWMKQVRSINGLLVRRAVAVGKDSMRLDLVPSEEESRDFLKHLHRLGPDEGFSVEIPSDMLESMVAPEEHGSREHKIAALQGNCINLKMTLSNEGDEIEVLEASPDLSYILTGNGQTGFRPTLRFNRLFRQSVGDVARSFVFNHIRAFFRNQEGFLLPSRGTRPLEQYQKDLIRVLAPYTQSFCAQAEHAVKLGHASFDGDFLTVERRLSTFSEVLEAENRFAQERPNSPVYGNVTLSDIIGQPNEDHWRETIQENIDRVLGQTQRLAFAVDSLDTYVREKLPFRIAANAEKRIGRTLSEAEKKEVRQLFEGFFGEVLSESERKLAPLEALRQHVCVDRKPSPRFGLAAIGYLARDTRRPMEGVATMSNGAELNFRKELARLICDPRIVGLEMPEREMNTQKAANAVLLNYISRETLQAYWGVTEPLPCLAAFEALQDETEQKVTDRFTKRRHPLSDPAAIYKSFDAARRLITECTAAFLGAKTSKTETLIPPASLLQRLSARSPGDSYVTRSRGQLLRAACRPFRHVPEETINNFVKEVSLLTGRRADDYLKEAGFLAASGQMNRAEASAALVLHEAIESGNQKLAAKLDQFGKTHIPDFSAKLEAALDSRIRVQSLTAAALTRLTSELPGDMVKALSPESHIEGELADAKTSAVASAALKTLKATLRDSLEFFKMSLPASLELKNIESCVYSGPQSARIVSEIIDEAIDETLPDYFRLASVPGPSSREHQMDVRAADLAERAEHSRGALEIEAESRCYPNGRSPKRVARELLAQALNKAALGAGKLQIDPYAFAPPSFA
jgi:hypothetical protein